MARMKKIVVSRVECSKQFQCGDSLCIPKAWRCDRDVDCSNGEDEKDCSE